MQSVKDLVGFVMISNWILLLAAGILGCFIAPAKVALGVILGGLIVAVNFHILKHTLERMFQPETVLERGRSVVGNVLVKYYLRFAVSAGIIFWLISKHIVHPLGLLAGLSVVVASIFLAAALALTRIFFKEAV